MMPITAGIRQGIGLVLLVAALGATAAFADDYTPVNQLLRSGQLVDAMAKADQYLEKNPRDPQMRFLKGLIQQESGKPGDAIATYTRLIEDYPELPEPYNNVAVLYAAQGQLEGARAALEMATRTSKSYAIAHENLGDVYARLASQAYSQALQIDRSLSSVPPKLALTRQLINASAPASSTGTGDRARAPAAAASGAK